MFSGLILLGPVEDKKLGPGQHLTVVAQESQSRAKWGGTLESALPGVGLSPTPVLTQKVPSFRLSHGDRENLCEAGPEEFPHHFLLGWGVGPCRWLALSYFLEGWSTHGEHRPLGEPQLLGSHWPKLPGINREVPS